MGTRGRNHWEPKAGPNAKPRRELMGTRSGNHWGTRGGNQTDPKGDEGLDARTAGATRGGEGQGARTRPEPRGATAGAGFTN